MLFTYIGEEPEMDKPLVLIADASTSRQGARA
jgi:hypothetical protein